MAPKLRLTQVLSEVLVGCVLTCVDNARLVIALACILAGLSLGVTVNFLSVNTDTSRMIDRDLPFRQRFNDLVAAFPQLQDTIVVIVDADDPDMAVEAARSLAASFRSRPNLYSDVYAPEIDPFFEAHGLLYLGEAELRSVAQQLQSGIPVLAALAQDQSLRGLSQFMQVIGYSAQQGVPLTAFSPFLAELDRVVRDHGLGKKTDMRWAEFLVPDAGKRSGTRKFIILKPVLDYTSLEPAEAAIAEARLLAKDPETLMSDTVRIRFTGDIALNAEELRSVSDGAVLAGIVSLVLVSLVLIFGVRSWRLVTASLATLIIGLVLTAGFATITVGYLNLISVAFAVLFVGLGIDFAIHFALRYEEEIRSGRMLSVAFANTAEGVGGALAVCTGAAALGFLAFTPTSFVGMSQLGLISAAGMVIAFVTSITVLPAFLAVLPLRAAKPMNMIDDPLKAGSSNWRVFAAIVTLMVCAFGVFFLPQVRFDGDPIRLKDPNAPSVQTFLELFETATTTPYLAEVLTGNEAEAGDLISRLTALQEVGHVVSIFSFLPTEQERKLPVIGQLRVAMRQVPPSVTVDIGDEARLQALQTTVTTLGQLAALPDKAFAQAASALSKTLSGYIEKHGGDAASVRALERSIFRTLPPTIMRINHLVSAAEVTVATLPANIRDRYVSQDGRLRLEVFPADNISDQTKMRAFTDAVLKVAPQATGSPVEILGAADVVVAAMVQATSIAAVLIIVVLLLTLRNLIDVILVLIPIVMAAILTLATTVWLGTPFNFANVIVLPLLIGLGVAGGVHLVVRARLSQSRIGLMETNTPRAVLLSALTTIGSFASLSMSSHRGMASMGELLGISILFTLICTLVVLPNLIRWFTGRTV